MNSIALLHNGVSKITIAMAALDGITMPQRKFLVDTGATRTTIPKNILINELKYTEEFIKDNKKLLPENEKPLMADGQRADVYQVKAPRINIGGHEMQPDYILTSDTITSLTLLLGLDIMRYFKFTYDFDAIDEYAPHGRMFYEFRNSCLKPFEKLGDSFAYNLNEQ